jgi:hypothetical protein
MDKFDFQFRQYFTIFVIRRIANILLKLQIKNNNAMSQIEPILQENKNRLFFQSNIMIFGNGIRKWRLVLDCRRN